MFSVRGSGVIIGVLWLFTGSGWRYLRQTGVFFMLFYVFLSQFSRCLGMMRVPEGGISCAGQGEWIFGRR